MTVPRTEIRHSVCALDCPDACGMRVHIRDGRAVRLEGDPTHPVTRGFLCGKVARYLDRQYHQDRLLHPLERTGPKGSGQFKRISWDEALDKIAARLRATAEEFSPEAVLPYSYAGNMGYLNNRGMDRRFFHKFGASRLDRTICSSAGGAALTELFGTRLGTEPEQFAHSKLIICWSANIHATNVHLWPFIVEARRRGARLITIDPVLTRTASLADQHLFINPGSDLALALGLMHVILAENLHDADYIERHATGFEGLRALAQQYPPQHTAALTGIPADAIVTLAREYATTKPAVIRVNYGVQRSERGGRAIQAVAALAALTGNFRHVGGGVALSTGGAFQIDNNALERPDLGPSTRIINMSQIGRALEETQDPPIKMMVVYNSNPVAIAPDVNRIKQGFAREDIFTVVLEQFQTDTADYADIVLPVTTFLENTDLYFAYGHYYMQMARPALPAEGEARSNHAIFQALAQRMGYTDPAFLDTEDDVIRQCLASGSRFLDGITLERLDQEKHVRLNIAPAGEPFLPHAEGNFPTPSGKIEFKPDQLAYVPPVESRHGAERGLYPLELITNKNADGMNSTFGNRPEVDQQTAQAVMHPGDAAARHLSTGDLIRVFNARGSLRVHVKVEPAVHPGVIRIPAVRWNKAANDGQSVNVLTSDRLTDMGAGATFYNCLVEVEKCGD